MSIPNFFPAAALAGYTFWLLAFPMGGPLLGPAEGEAALLWFLAPHVAALYAASLAHRPGFARWSAASGALAVAATATFPLWPDHPAAVLVAAGVTSGPVAVRAGVLLKSAEAPSLQAALALVAANLLLAALGALPVSGALPFAAAALALCAPCFLPVGAAPSAWPAEPESDRDLVSALPFLFVFHVVSGLFYGSLMPAYEKMRVVPAAELLFYVAAVLAAAWLFRRRAGGALTGAILLGMLSLGAFHGGTVTAVHVAMYAMQASAGFMDLFVLVTLLRHPDPVRAFGLGLGTLCLGILGGNIASRYAEALPGGVTVTGSMALNLALLTLHWLRRGTGRVPPAPAEPASGPPARPESAPRRLPPGLGARLSSMERTVLEMVVDGRTFKETAAALSVSESSVKTYMKRIYEKAGVTGKGALLEKLSRSAEGGTGEAPAPRQPGGTAPGPSGDLATR